MNTNANKKEGPPYLVGSIHRLSDGYGYGARIPTERNLPTFPQSVPKYRHPPEEPNPKSKPRQLVPSGEKGFERHAAQIVFQESGQYGRHYLFKDSEPVSINTQPLRKDLLNTDPYQTLVRTRFGGDSSRKGSSRTEESTARSQASTGRIDSSRIQNNFGTEGYSGTRTLYPQSFDRGLDRTFPRNCKYDLIASTMPPRPIWEQRWVAVSNSQNKEASAGWSRNLRQKPPNNTNVDG
jgi:hypothetical protein